MRATVVLAGALALVGCQTVAENQSIVASAATEPPANYRAIVATHVRSNFFDPYTVRDASIAPPKLGKAYVTGTLGVYESGWAVCMRANAKNRMGAYAGSKLTVYIIRGGAVVATQDEPNHYDVRQACDGARYEPFPEIEERRARS